MVRWRCCSQVVLDGDAPVVSGDGEMVDEVWRNEAIQMVGTT
jgi:hypothetical protein